MYRNEQNVSTYLIVEKLQGNTAQAFQLIRHMDTRIYNICMYLLRFRMVLWEFHIFCIIHKYAGKFRGFGPLATAKS